MTGVAEGFLTLAWVGFVTGLIRNIAGLGFSFLGNVTAFGVSCVCLLGVTYLPGHQVLTGIALVYAASFLGCVVSVIFREPNIMLPVALMAPLVDYWTVSFGPVKQVITGAPNLIPKVSAAIPGVGALHPIAFIGAGDFLFMAMFLAATERLRMQPTKTAWFFVVLVSLAMILVISMDVFQSIGMPGLVVIGLGFVAANIRHFKLTRSEAIITSGLAVLLIAAIVYIGLGGAH